MDLCTKIKMVESKVIFKMIYYLCSINNNVEKNLSKIEPIKLLIYCFFGSTGHISEYKSLIIFLNIVSRGNSYNDGANRFQHSIEIICRYVRNMLRALVSLASEIICHKDVNQVLRGISTDPRFFPWFKVKNKFKII